MVRDGLVQIFGHRLRHAGARPAAAASRGGGDGVTQPLHGIVRQDLAVVIDAV